MISPLLIKHPGGSPRNGFPGQVLRAKAVTELVKHRKVPRAVHVCPFCGALMVISWNFINNKGDIIYL
jgi:hypothetical protein